MIARLGSGFFLVSLPILLVLFAGAGKVSASELIGSRKISLHDARVLVLHSYHYGFSWSDSLSAGIRSVFAEQAKDAELKFEFLDTRFCSSEAYLSVVKETLGAKYTNRRVDIIIACDDHALNFMLKYGKDLFPDVPVVFCSVSGYKPEMRKQLGLTGLRESIDIKSTVETALRLHPGTKQIAVILDRSRTGQGLKKKAASVLDELADSIRIRYLEDLTVEQLKKQIPKLPKKTIDVIRVYNMPESPTKPSIIGANTTDIDISRVARKNEIKNKPIKTCILLVFLTVLFMFPPSERLHSNSN